MGRAKRVTHHLDSVAATLRSGGGLELLSPFNEKTPKGEAEGFLTAMMYLAPHTMAGGKSLCPHSTPACRAGCLFSAGRGTTPRVINARLRRTLWYLERRDSFFDQLVGELFHMQGAADEAGLELAIRLNGTSDILWEREVLEEGRTLFDLFPRATFYDYTRTPAAHRKVPPNWRLTFSLADDPLERAVEHLRAGRSVAAVAPEAEKEWVGGWIEVGEHVVTVVDGDEHDLRFLDPAPALVLLKPKGALRRGGPMVHENIFQSLRRAARQPETTR
jgi:hypothetical protein